MEIVHGLCVCVGGGGGGAHGESGGIEYHDINEYTWMSRNGLWILVRNPWNVIEWPSCKLLNQSFTS